MHHRPIYVHACISWHLKRTYKSRWQAVYIEFAQPAVQKPSTTIVMFYMWWEVVHHSSRKRSAACKRQYSSYGEAKPPGLLQARTAWPDNSPWISVGGLQHECMHMQQSVSHTLECMLLYLIMSCVYISIAKDISILRAPVTWFDQSDTRLYYLT